MKMKRPTSDRFYGALKHAQTILMGISAGIAPFAKADLAWIDKFLPLFTSFVKFVGGAAWFLTPAFAGAGLVVKLAKERVGNPESWKLVEELLNDVRKELFPADTQHQQHYRITLFKHYTWLWLPFRLWPWSGWLRPVARTGHMTQESNTLFRVGNSSHDCKGVAGLAWSADGPIYLENLPDMLAEDAVNKAVRYAKETNISEPEALRMRPTAQSYYAVRVEVKGGVQWGVLVVDSRDPTLPAREKLQRESKTLNRYLTQLLKGM